jgi:dihydroorotate dehydrogenase
MYKFLRNLLFLFPTEGVHYFSMNILRLLCKWGLLKKGLSAYARPSAAEGGLEREVFGLRFANPIGLGAGFDKNALYLEELGALGFGFVEIGTVTPLPQAGNDKPRLFRLPMDQALINRMGFNNDGATVIAERLKKWREKNRSTAGSSDPVGRSSLSGANRSSPVPLIVGGNIGKNKITPNEEAWKDYEYCFRALFDYVDYFVVNVSSPNTPGLRELQESSALRKILTNLQTVNAALSGSKALPPKPLLLKIAPDLNVQQLDEVIALALEIRLDGLVAANTTIGREKLLSPSSMVETIGAGGLSGAPLSERSTAILQHIQKRTGGSIPVISSGGIFTGADAKEKMQSGASLVQVWTGFIYEGPLIVQKICTAL